MSDKIFLGSRVGALETGINTQIVSRVNLSVDSEHYYTAGNDTGKTIEVSCPWGSQEMANDILQSIQSHQYMPFSAKDSLIDPAAELGDMVTVGGVYSQIVSAGTKFDSACAPDLSAPGVDEIEDEYPYETKAERENRRQLAQTRSMIQKTATEILLKVESDIGGLSSSLSVELNKITSQVTGIDGRVSKVEQTADGLTSTVQGLGGKVSKVEQTIDGLTITTSSGTTKIKGSVIETGSLVLTGSISWADFDSAAQSKINGIEKTAEDALFAAENIKLPKYIKDTYIDSTTVRSPTIEGGEIIGAKIYAVDGGSTYAEMDADYFALMRTGSSQPRAVLEATSRSVTLILGAGSGGDLDAGRVFLQKGFSGNGNQAAVGYVTSRGDPIGIVFQDDGTMSFVADEFRGLYLTFS